MVLILSDSPGWDGGILKATITSQVTRIRLELSQTLRGGGGCSMQPSRMSIPLDLGGYFSDPNINCLPASHRPEKREGLFYRFISCDRSNVHFDDDSIW